MFLYFLRHASAGTQLSSAKKDEKRGLDKDGIEQCGYIGRALAAELGLVDRRGHARQMARLLAQLRQRGDDVGEPDVLVAERGALAVAYDIASDEVGRAEKDLYKLLRQAPSRSSR